MKTLKFKSEKREVVTRELVSGFGETLYHCPEVDSILIKIAFKDGSCVSFKRGEIEDTMNHIFGGED